MGLLPWRRQTNVLRRGTGGNKASTSQSGAQPAGGVGRFGQTHDYFLKLYLRPPIPSINQLYCVSMSAFNLQYAASGLQLRLLDADQNDVGFGQYSFLTDALSGWIVNQASIVSQVLPETGDRSMSVTRPVRVRPYSQIIAGKNSLHAMTNNDAWIRQYNRNFGPYGRIHPVPDSNSWCIDDIVES